MDSKTKFEQADENFKEAFERYRDLFNELTGGAFEKGYREATALERVQEWDTLTPEQIAQLKMKKGDEWLYKQQAEINKLRKDLNA